MRDCNNTFTVETHPRRRHRNKSDGRRPWIEKDEPVEPVIPYVTVKDVDLNISTNSKDHQTDKYFKSETSESLIIRRGKTFDITIEFDREYDSGKDDLKLVFLAGKNPSQPRGTRVILILSDEDYENRWGAWILEKRDKTLTIRINTPPTCFVGIWNLQISTIMKIDKKAIVFKYSHDQHVYILFNPWCDKDLVNFPEEDLLKEYILNDVGIIYTGSERQINGRKWNFGQFEKNILDCAMYLLDTHMPSWSARGDPIKMSRKISALVNSQDDNGVLVGKWTGSYENGKEPSSWKGSVAILNEYYKTKTPVRYGQCWVFSGIMTTLCRTLGLPVRSVTNFVSAHDHDGSMTIDKYWSEHAEPLEELNEDETWNFHVWNDVWMARPDLPDGYGGWQAVDATPQEASDGQYCCGPSPLEAIKRGEVYMPHDTPFIFAEVNADIVHWQMDKTGEMHQVDLDPRHIGKCISTKLPIGKSQRYDDELCDDPQREDITNEYKYPEGTAEERTAVIKANQESTKKGIYHDEDKQMDVEFMLMEKETVPYGRDFEIILKIQNKSKETRSIVGCISTTSMYYHGTSAKKVKEIKIEEIIKAHKAKEISLNVTFDEYYSKVVDQCHMKMSCMCHVQETKQIYVSNDTFYLMKPDLNIEAPSTGQIGEQVEIEITFDNPLPFALTDCELTVEGPGLAHSTVIPQNVVPANKTFRTSLGFQPKRKGAKELIVSFNSYELSMVEGSCQIEVKDSSI